ncbi:hypothetical protein HA402_014329 [Bradysia odoriphaga]|nr:hypothetical protein HA402_014329 [Bradysia odoriphaga]
MPDIFQLFVENLQGGTRPDDLRKLFQRYGHVVNCSVKYNYGFVGMANEAQGRDAIEKLTGYLLNGNPINVEVAYNGVDGKLANGPGIQLFVGNLNKVTRPHELRKLFQRYGHVVNCSLKYNYGFVGMANEAQGRDAIEKLTGYLLNGNPINVEVAYNGVDGKLASMTAAANGGRVQRVANWVEYFTAEQKIELFKAQRTKISLWLASMIAAANGGRVQRVANWVEYFTAEQKIELFKAQRTKISLWVEYFTAEQKIELFKAQRTKISLWLASMIAAANGGRVQRVANWVDASDFSAIR